MSEVFSYGALGVRFRSTISLPGLASSRAKLPEYSIEVREALPESIRSAQVIQEVRGVTVTILEYEDFIRIDYADGTKFHIDLTAKTIDFSWDRSVLTLEDACTYLTGPVIGLIAGIEGMACFHGAAAVVDGKGVLVVAPSEAGKSTTAAAFALEGFDVLSDDVCATSRANETLIIHPAFPRVRLWEPSVKLLFGSGDALPFLTPNWEKRYLDLGAIEKFAIEPAPLACVAVLDPSRSPDEFEIEEVDGAGAVMTLLGNSYPQSYRVGRLDRLVFETASWIARHTPIRRIPAYLPPRETVRRIVDAARHA